MYIIVLCIVSSQLYGSIDCPSLLGYEPADLTVHPPQNDREWVHFFRMGV